MPKRSVCLICGLLSVTVALGCDRESAKRKAAEDREIQLAHDLKISASKFLAENPVPIDAYVNAVGCIDLCYAKAWDQMDGFTEMRAEEPHFNQAVLEVVEEQGRKCSMRCSPRAKHDGCAALATSYDNCNGQALGALHPCNTMSWFKARQCCANNALSGPICDPANQTLSSYTAILPHLPSMVLTALRQHANE